MYKNRLQELCQKKYWAMPKYTSDKVGPDHNPRFTASVIVNGVCFEMTQSSRSSKEAQSEAARLAFEHFTTPEAISLRDPSAVIPGIQLPQGSSGGSSELNEASVPNGSVQPKSQEMSKDFNSNGVNLSVTTENIEVRDMLHLCKNQLHVLAQRRNMQPPLYSCARDGPPHALRFKAKVSVGGQTFESPDFFRTLREAEHAAAKAALMELSAGVQEGEHSFYKTRLQELAAKQGFSLQYKTITAGASHMPTFFSTVEVGGEVFSGKAAKTKKQAEMNAAKVAFSKLYEHIIQGMVNNGMSVSAAGLACAFGLEDNLSPLSLLASYVQEVNRTGKEMRRRQQCSYVSLIEANEKQVAALKLVLRCVVDHKLNSQEVAKWKIDKKIAKLERNNEKFEKNKNERNLKRKVGELGFTAQAKTREKHCQTTTTEASSLRPPPSAIPSQEKMVYDGLLHKAMFDGGFPGLLNEFTDASIKSSVALSYGSGMGGLLSRNVLGAFPGPVSGHGAPVGAGPMTDIIRTSGSVGVYAGLGNVLPLVDSGRTSVSGRARLYDWHEERAVNDLVGQSLLGMPPVAGQGLMGSLAMVKESSVPSHQGSTSSNLYQFADTVLQRESCYGSSHMGNAGLVYRPSDV